MNMGKGKYTGAFIAVTSLFFIWGFITVFVDGFVPRLKSVFELTYSEVGNVQVAYFIAYALISIPSGILISRFGYKKGIILGLGIAALGCLLIYAAASARIYNLFLLAFFTLASGITVLQVAANPYISELGPPSSASIRLNLSQGFNSFGTTIAPIFAAILLLSDNIKSAAEIESLSELEKASYYANEASAVQSPFIIIGIVLALLSLMFFRIKLPKILSSVSSFKDYASALKHSKLTFGAVAIFLYVGAEVALSSYYVNYFNSFGMAEVIKQNDALYSIANWLALTFKGLSVSEFDAKGVIGLFLTIYWGGAMIGRFFGSFIMNYIKPALLLAIFSLGAILLVVLAINFSGQMAFWCALMVGFFNSIMFPTIFTLSIADLGNLKPNGSAILCTAIVGGAVIPKLFGLLTDLSGFKTAFVLPVFCYLFIGFFAYQILNKKSWRIEESS